MKISKKSEYAIKAVITIAKHANYKPLKISEISKKESIPIKFLERILLNLKNSGILKSQRGAKGGYLLGKPKDDISIGMIIEIIDGPFDPVGLYSGNQLSAGLEKCFGQMIEIVNGHLNQFTIKIILEIEKPENLLAFEI